MNIFGWAADESSGCWWYRIKLPLDALRDLGHRAEYAARLPPEWWDQPDVVIGQRIATPEATERWQRLAHQPGRPLMVYETDDDLFHIDKANVRAHQYFARPEIQDNVRRCITLADLVTVTTEQLADQIRPLNPNVAVLPNYIPRRLLQHPMVTDPEPGGPTVIGWAGTQTHAADFDEVAAPLVRLIRNNTRTAYRQFGLVHDGKPGLFTSLADMVDAGERIELGGWYPLPYYYEPLEFHIGLAPLRSTVFNQSKSPIKAMEYAARGVATIASNTGPYRGYIVNGVTGLLADRPRDWARHLRDLVNDPTMRRALAVSARGHVEQLTIEDHAHEWADAITTAMTGRSTPVC